MFRPGGSAQGDAAEEGALVVTLFSGDRLHFRRYELVRALLHPLALPYYAVAVVGLTVVPARVEFAQMTVWERLYICGVTAAVALGLVMVMAAVWEWWNAAKGQVFAHASPFLAIGTLVGVYCGNVISLKLTGHVQTTLVQTLLMWAFFHIYGEVVTHLLMYRGMPKIVLSLRKRQPETPTSGAGPMVEIGGRRFALALLRRIEAEGNYLRVTVGEARHFVPGPFGKATAALPESAGMRIGRSDWVAAGEVAGVRVEGRELAVVLRCGAAVRVAQARRKAVEDWARGLVSGSGQGDVDPEGEVVRGSGEGRGQRVRPVRPEHA